MNAHHPEPVSPLHPFRPASRSRCSKRRRSIPARRANYPAYRAILRNTRPSGSEDRACCSNLRRGCSAVRAHRSAFRAQCSAFRARCSNRRTRWAEGRARSANGAAGFPNGGDRASTFRDAGRIVGAGTKLVRAPAIGGQEKSRITAACSQAGKAERSGQAALASGVRGLRAKRSPTDSRRASRPWLRPVTLSSA